MQGEPSPAEPLQVRGAPRRCPLPPTSTRRRRRHRAGGRRLASYSLTNVAPERYEAIVSQAGNARPIRATLAIIPLAVFFPLEVFRLSFGLGGAVPFSLGFRLGWMGTAVVTVVLGASLVAFVTGGARRDTDLLSEGSKRLQRYAGLLCWAFVVLHLSYLWGALNQVGAEPLGQYNFLRNRLSLPINVAFYAVGLGAVSLYLVQGIPVVMRGWGAAQSPRGYKRLQIGVGVLAWLFFVFTINVLSHYATGRALWVG